MVEDLPPLPSRGALNLPTVRSIVCQYKMHLVWPRCASVAHSVYLHRQSVFNCDLGATLHSRKRQASVLGTS